MTSTPHTYAGTLVLTALRQQRPAYALHRLGDSLRAVALLRHLFTVALRRGFAGRDRREITGYVRDLLTWHRLPARGELARQGEALIRSALGEPELADGIPPARRHELVCYVVGDLVRPPGADPAVVESLVEQAELRAERYEPAGARR